MSGCDVCGAVSTVVADDCSLWQIQHVELIVSSDVPSKGQDTAY